MAKFVTLTHLKDGIVTVNLDRVVQLIPGPEGTVLEFEYKGPSMFVREDLNEILQRGHEHEFEAIAEGCGYCGICNTWIVIPR